MKQFVENEENKAAEEEFRHRLNILSPTGDFIDENDPALHEGGILDVDVDEDDGSDAALEDQNSGYVSPLLKELRAMKLIERNMAALPFSKKGYELKRRMRIKWCPVPECNTRLTVRNSRIATFKDISDFYASLGTGGGMPSGMLIDGETSKRRLYVPPILAPFVLPMPASISGKSGRGGGAKGGTGGGHSGLGGHTYLRVLRRRYALLVKEPRFLHRHMKVCKSCAVMFRRKARMEQDMGREVVASLQRMARRKTFDEIRERRNRGPIIPDRRFDRLADPFPQLKGKFHRGTMLNITEAAAKGKGKALSKSRRPASAGSRTRQRRVRGSRNEIIRPTSAQPQLQGALGTSSGDTEKNDVSQAEMVFDQIDAESMGIWNGSAIATRSKRMITIEQAAIQHEKTCCY